MRFDGFSEFHLGTNSGSESNNRKDTIRDIDAAKKSETRTPEEIIQNTTMLLISSLKNDLLKLVKENSPSFFERLVVDLLVEIGYGGSHQDAAQAIGKTNDGGIDGVISEDRLGLDKIYIQAKR